VERGCYDNQSSNGYSPPQGKKQQASLGLNIFTDSSPSVSKSPPSTFSLSQPKPCFSILLYLVKHLFSLILGLFRVSTALFFLCANSLNPTVSSLPSEAIYPADLRQIQASVNSATSSWFRYKSSTALKTSSLHPSHRQLEILLSFLAWV
jgi:hypothetical protein